MRLAVDASQAPRRDHGAASGTRRSLGRPGSRLALLIVLVLLPFGLSEFNTYLLQGIVIYGLVAIGLNILLGYSGQVSLGHAALLAIGAYTGALTIQHLSLPLFASLAVAAALTGLVGWLLGWIAARVSGHYLAIATLAFAIIVQKGLYELSITGGRNGMGVPSPTLFGHDLASSSSQYWLSLGVVALAVLFASAVLRSRVGRAWIALKNSDISASASGIDVGQYRVKAFALSAWLTGLAGALYGFQVSYLSADAFTLTLSIAFLIAVVVGGMGSLVGSILGAAFLVLLPQLLADQGQLQQIIYGFAIVVVVLVLPRGLVQIGELLQRLVPRRAKRRSAGQAEAVEPDLRRREEVPALVLAGLSKNFSGVQALADVGFTVEPGEIVGLVGPNGAGKTTVLNVLSGFYRVDAGSAQYGTHDLTKLRPHQLATVDVGRSFQQALIFEDLTVRENLLVGGHSSLSAGIVRTGLATPGARAEERRLRQHAVEVLSMIGMQDRADVRARDLAFGERKLVDVGRALMGWPSLLLLDEPAAGLNTVETKRLQTLISRVREGTGCSVLIIEHDIDLIMSLCDRVVVLDFGALIAHGEPDVVRTDPAVVEAYLGLSADAAS